MARVPDEPFLPYATERTVLRLLGPADTAAFAAYRSDPHIARYQDWALPFTDDSAAELITSQAGLTGPVAGRWVQVGIEHGGELVGDLAIGLDPSGKLATLGYTLRRQHHGRGLAVEAAGSAVDRLFDLTGVHRISATLDPENVASARLLERLGFRYEGRSVGAAQVRGEWLDDDRYALLAEDRAAWLARSTAPPSRVRLVRVQPANLARVTALAVHHSQERFVPSVRDALLEVLVPPVEHGVPLSFRVRGVEADGEIVGVVVLSDATAANLDPDVRWLIIDKSHQRRGIGRAVVRLVADHERRDEQETLQARWPAGNVGATRFFSSVGFDLTPVADGMVEARLDLGTESG